MTLSLGGNRSRMLLAFNKIVKRKKNRNGDTVDGVYFSMTDEISQAIVRNVFVWSNALDQTCVMLKRQPTTLSRRTFGKGTTMAFYRNARWRSIINASYSIVLSKTILLHVLLIKLETGTQLVKLVLGFRVVF